MTDARRSPSRTPDDVLFDAAADAAADAARFVTRVQLHLVRAQAVVLEGLLEATNEYAARLAERHRSFSGAAAPHRDNRSDLLAAIERLRERVEADLGPEHPSAQSEHDAAPRVSRYTPRAADPGPGDASAGIRTVTTTTGSARRSTQV